MTSPAGPEATAGTGEGVWRATLDPATGALDGALVLDVPAPSFLAVHPTAPVLYAVGETAPGTVACLDLAPDGALRERARVASGGDHPCHALVHPDGRALYVTDYSTGEVAVLPLDADGGFRADVVGRNRWAALYAGIRLPRVVVATMCASGALAGLGGAIETIGVVHRYESGSSAGLGFDGITIALLARALAAVEGAVLVDALDRHGALARWLQAAGFAIERGYTRMALDTDARFGDADATFAIAGPVARTDSKCNTGELQCCNDVKESNDESIAGLLGLVANFVKVPITGHVGVTCSPISVVSVSGTTWYAFFTLFFA